MSSRFALRFAQFPLFFLFFSLLPAWLRAYETYEDWRLRHFTPEQLAQPWASETGDANGDGTANLLHYAYGLSPWVSPAPTLPGSSIDNSGDHLLFTFPRRTGPGSVRYQPLFSRDLQPPWLSGADYFSLSSRIAVDADLELVTVRAHSPLSIDARQFFRLQVSRLSDTNDTDLDGLDDAWELLHFSNLDQGYYDDFDGDGIVNGDTFLLGRDPTQSNRERDLTLPTWGVLNALGVASETATELRLGWQAASDDRGGAMRYLVYQNGRPLGAATTALEHTVPLADLAGRYSWEIRPLDHAGNIGPASNTVARELTPVVTVQPRFWVRQRSGSHGFWGYSRALTGGGYAYFENETETWTWDYDHDQTAYDGDGAAASWGDEESSGTKVTAKSRPLDADETLAVSGNFSGEASYTHQYSDGIHGSEWDFEGGWTTQGNLSGTRTNYQIVAGERVYIGTEALPDVPHMIRASILVSSTPEKDTYKRERQTTTGGSSTAGGLSWTTTEEAQRIIDYTGRVNAQEVEAALRDDLPDFASIAWSERAPRAVRNWGSTSLLLTESEYKVRVPITIAGARYRVQWLEVFFPEQSDGSPVVPIALTEREVVLAGTGSAVESEPYQLSAPEEEGSISLVPVTISLSVAPALAVNEDFDERVADDESEWVPDADTPSPLRSDGTVALADLAPLWLGSHAVGATTAFGPETRSVKLALVSGGSRVRLHALAPTGSGEDEAYTEEDWREIESGEELWGLVYGREDEEGNPLPAWSLYLEGVEPGQVALRLDVDRYGEVLSEEKTLYVTCTEIVARDPVTNETYPLGGLLEGGEPRPTVDLQVDSAQLTPGGDTLVVSLSGEVFDPLSETLIDALLRTHALTFEVNGRTVDGIVNLPVLGGGGALARPWQSAHFAVPFTRTLHIPVHGPGVKVVRAVTSPNLAGLRGWDEAAIVVARSPEGPPPAVAGRLAWEASPGSGTADTVRVRLDGADPSPTDPHMIETGPATGRFSGSIWADGASRAAILELAPLAVAAGEPSKFVALLTYSGAAGTQRLAAIWRQTGGLYTSADVLDAPGLRHPLRIEGVHLGEGTVSGPNLQAVVRTDGLAEAPDDLYVSLLENGEAHLTAGLTFSPKRFFIVQPGNLGQPVRYMVTLDDAVPLPSNEALKIVRAGRNSFMLRVGNQLVAEAAVEAIAAPTPANPNPTLPQAAANVDQIAEFYKLLYLRPTPGDGGVQLGHILSQAFDDSGGLLQIVEGDEVQGEVDATGRLIIEVGEMLDPLSAAQGVFEELVKLSVHPTLQGEILLNGYGADLFAAGRLNAVRAQCQELGAVVLVLYKEAVSIANPGAEWAIVFDELSQGNWSAVFGFLPFVPAGTKYLVKHRTSGAILMSIEGEGFTRLAQGLRNFKVNPEDALSRKETVHLLKNLRDTSAISQGLIDVLVKSKHLKLTKGSSRSNLRRILGDPPGDPDDYNAHHWLPLKYEDNFLIRCLDPNDAPHGSWLPKAIHQAIHDNPVPGFEFAGRDFLSANYNDLWGRFFLFFPDATETQINAFLIHLRLNIYKL